MLEAQGLFVNQLQESGKLIREVSFFNGSSSYEEHGVLWTNISYGVNRNMITCYSRNCNNDLLQFLPYQSPIEIVSSRDHLPISTDGSLRIAVGLVRSHEGVIYLSPGFDIQKYESENPFRF